MNEFMVIQGSTKATEYFCNDCGQLRLNLVERTTCGNCGKSNIVVGEVGALDKDNLKRQWEARP